MKAKTLTAHTLRVNSIKLVLTTLAIFAIMVAVSSCQPAKNGCKSTHGMSGYSSIKVDLPEEIKAITCDRENPEPLYAHWDTTTNTLVFSFKHYKITRQGTDDRGLTSIVFNDPWGEWALDYLAPNELDSMRGLLEYYNKHY